MRYLRTSAVVFCVVLAAMLSVSTASATCTQGLQCGFNCYQYLYNVNFSQTAGCGWSYTDGSSAILSGGSDMCGIYGSYVMLSKPSSNSWNTTDTYQSIAIPSGESRTHWLVGYNVKVNDPNLSASNAAYVYVYDVTTSTVVATGTTYYGTGDPDCGSRSFSFTGNYGGHTLEVIIHAVVVNTNTHFYFTNLQLDVS